MKNEELLNVLKSVRGLFANNSPFYIRKLGAPITNADQSRIDEVFIAVDAAIASEGAAVSPQPNLQAILKEFVAKYARLNGVREQLATPKYDHYVEGASDFADELEKFFAAAPAQEPEIGLKEHLAHVQQFLNDLWAYSIDPLHEGMEGLKVAEVCDALLKAAKDNRDREYAQDQPVENSRTYEQGVVDAEQREIKAIREGYKAEICSGCDTVLLAHKHFVACQKSDCPMKDGKGSVLEQLLLDSPHAALDTLNIQTAVRFVGSAESDQRSNAHLKYQGREGGIDER